MLSIIIPAHNEAAYIGACLDALLIQRGPGLDDIQLVVAANGCTDATVAIARTRREAVQARGWSLVVLDLPEPGKTHALNRGDAAALGDMRLYLDADVVCAQWLLMQAVAVLDRPVPIYVSGKLFTTPARSWVTRCYVNLWTRLPFITHGVPGSGLFAVNAPARARWSRFPDIIADDSFVRLHFAPEERIGVPAAYVSPIAEGWRGLVRVRRRWEAGSRQIAKLFPNLLANDGKPRLGAKGHVRLMLRLPVSYCVYAAIKIAARMGHNTGWARGR